VAEGTANTHSCSQGEACGSLGESMSENFYRRMFLIASVWNIGGGAVIASFGGLIFSIAGLSLPEPPAYFYSWVALFMVFGIGYYMVYRDMYRNKNIVILGIIGKLAFSIIFAYNMIAYPNKIPTLFLAPLIGDLVFAALFLGFLNFARKKSK
jgi:hypothetical protein